MSDPKYIDIGTPFEKLVEECGELLQAASKINRFGPDNRHPDGGPTNLQTFKGEWADLNEAYSRYINSVLANQSVQPTPKAGG